MLEAARKAASDAANPPLLIGVTVLTSLADADLPAIGWAGSAASNATRLAQLAAACGLDGVVCSAREATEVKRATHESFITVTPGIRLAEDSVGDQSRVMTPRLARTAGADYLVMGRPITQATDPALRLRQIAQSLVGGA